MMPLSLRRFFAAVAIILFSTLGVLAIGPASATSTWGAAQEVAGVLNTQNNASVTSISCSSAGNCSAGGYYSDSAGGGQAFVVDEVGGTWGTAQEVAGGLNTQNNAIVRSISCSSAGNCSAGGNYSDSAGGQAFVVDEVGGTWGTAQEVAGGLNPQNGASVSSISCSSAGNCSAAGQYRDSAGGQAFVVDETTAVTPTTTVPATVPATLAATGTNLTLPLGLATALLGLGGLSVLRAQRRRS